jgi:hypothetical protein
MCRFSFEPDGGSWVESGVEWDEDAFSDAVEARMAAGPDPDQLSIEEAFGDGGCVRRIRARRYVRYIIGPQGRGRLRSPTCRRV